MSVGTRSRRGSAAPVAIDPRIQERRRAVDRRHSRKRRVLVGALAALTLLGAGAWPILHSHFFAAEHIVVTGNVHTPTPTVLAVAGLAEHPPLIDVHAGAAERALDALPWVARATVGVNWPTGVAVTVTERRPVAAVQEGANAWAELDATGRVLATTTAAPTLVQLTGVPRPGAPGSTLGAARALLGVAAALPVAFKAEVLRLAPAPTGHGVDLALAGGIGVVFGAPSQLPAKFEDIASLLAGAQLVPGAVIDVSVPDSPLVANDGAAKG